MDSSIFWGAWVVCGFIHYGMCVYYFQTKYPTIARETVWSDRGFAAIASIGGPIALFVSLIYFWGRYGWKL